MRPLDHLTSIKFTRDREALRQAVASFSGRKDSTSLGLPSKSSTSGDHRRRFGLRARDRYGGCAGVTSRIGELEATRRWYS